MAKRVKAPGKRMNVVFPEKPGDQERFAREIAAGRMAWGGDGTPLQQAFRDASLRAAARKLLASGGLGQLVRLLGKSGEYRVLRKLAIKRRYGESLGKPERVGLIVDTETTGLDAAHDKIIELCITSFRFTEDGVVTDVLDSATWLQDPKQILSSEICAITGLTNQALKDQTIDNEAVSAFVKTASLCVSHNAAFDRRFLEAAYPVFAEIDWACSLTDIDWAAEQVFTRGLGQLLSVYGLFHGAHRAKADCDAVLHVLANPLPLTGTLGLVPVLRSSRRRTVRIFAEGAAFDTRKSLKNRGYRWNPESQPDRPKAWYIDVDEECFASEREWLAANVYGGQRAALPIHWITAKERFSIRV